MKVKIASTLLIMSTLFFLGCDKSQPVTRPPDGLPPSRAEAQAKAIEVVKTLQKGQTELFAKANEIDNALLTDIEALYLESDVLEPIQAGFTTEALGAPFWYSLAHILLSIHLEENPKEIKLILDLLEQLIEEVPDIEKGVNLTLPTKELPIELQASMPTVGGLYVEFLTLKYHYRTKRGKAVFDLFTGSAKNGTTTINPKKVESRFGITYQPGDVLFFLEPKSEAMSDPPGGDFVDEVREPKQ